MRRMRVCSLSDSATQSTPLMSTGAAVGPLEQAGNVQQGGFAGARRPEQSDGLARKEASAVAPFNTSMRRLPCV